MDIQIHRHFLDSLLDLRKRDQQRVRKTLKMIMAEQDAKGLRPHKVGGFWSYSASDSLRIISFKSKSGITIIHVGKHDEAYNWADRHEAITNEKDRFVGFLDSHNVNIDKSEERGYDEVYESEEFIKYISFGLPTGLSQFLAKAHDDEILDAISSLAPEIQEAVLDIATGGEPDADAEAPSDVEVIENDEALETALGLPGHKWRLFLHPRQRFAVDMPTGSHVMIRGGPGTGKTVTAIHRYARLINSPNADHNPVFLALNNTTKNIIEDRLNKIGISRSSQNVILSGNIEYKRDDINDFLNRYSHIIIDEAQDMPLKLVSKLKLLFDDKRGHVIPHFLCYDPNQCIMSPSGDALQKISDYFDNVTLNYSYRSTKQNVGYSQNVLDIIHTTYEGQRFQDRHKIDSSRSEVTSNMISAMEGPEAESELVKDMDRLAEKVRSTIRRFDRYYDQHYPKSIIAAGSSDSRYALKQKLRNSDLGTPFLKPREVKGREFFAGVVVDLTDFYHKKKEGKIVIKGKKYKDVSSLYVAITRFRDRVTCFYTKRTSPFHKVPNRYAV